MAAQRTTFGKIQRDRAKREKQEAKRQRKAEARAEQEEETTPEAPTPVGADAEGELTAAELLEQVEALHKAFDDKKIDFETFEERKAALMARISV